MPMRSIPFEVGVPAGHEQQYTHAHWRRFGFDLMSQKPVREYKSRRRDDDRYLFLEAMMSAEKALYIGCIGHSH
ncbi:hypothetical protein ACNKHQ_16260 [Shigella flexneri]